MQEKTKVVCPKCGAEFETAKVDPEKFGNTGLSHNKTKCPECRAFTKMRRGR